MGEWKGNKKKKRTEGVNKAAKEKKVMELIKNQGGKDYRRHKPLYSTNSIYTNFRTENGLSI